MPRAARVPTSDAPRCAALPDPAPAPRYERHVLMLPPKCADVVRSIMRGIQVGRAPAVMLFGALIAALAGCTPAVPSPEASPSTPACPNPHGGACLGPLEAGTYTTQRFTPELTYEVPEGWANYEDLPGNFLLVPLTGSLDGVDAGTSDYIGLATSIAALGLDCNTVLADTGHTPADIAAWFKAEPSLVVTDGGPVEVGGLSGVVLDLTLAEGGGVLCEGLHDAWLVPLFIGRPPSQLEHAMITGLTMRLYLLAYGDGTLVIEVDDLAGGANLAEYSEIVDSMRFVD